MTQPRRGGSYELRRGKPVLVERGGQPFAPDTPAPRAVNPDRHKSDNDEDTQKSATGRP